MGHSIGGGVLKDIVCGDYIVCGVVGRGRFVPTYGCGVYPARDLWLVLWRARGWWERFVLGEVWVWSMDCGGWLVGWWGVFWCWAFW